MGVTININGLSLVHKGSGGMAMATVPDVCKTPSPGGPVPVPYPNIARSANLAKGSTSVKVDGGNSAANKGSEFATSSGDEAGTLGGVKSGVNMKEATWLTYSMDVKIEGKNAARLTDKMLMNHGNTVCLGGAINPPLFTPPTDPNCAKIYAKIYEYLFSEKTPHPDGPNAGPMQGTKGLAIRWVERAQNAGNWRAGVGQDLSHMNEYRKTQKALQEKLEQFRNKKQRNCSDDDLPPGADLYAQQEPELGPGRPLVPTPAASSSMSIQDLAKALGVSATVVIAVIAVTRLIRCIPPLWPLQASPI